MMETATVEDEKQIYLSVYSGVSNFVASLNFCLVAI